MRGNLWFLFKIEIPVILVSKVKINFKIKKIFFNLKKLKKKNKKQKDQKNYSHGVLKRFNQDRMSFQCGRGVRRT